MQQAVPLDTGRPGTQQAVSLDTVNPSTQQTVPLEDAADRAEAKKKPGVVRISLDEIGFWPDNRGSTGICSHHVHEIALDIMENKCRRARYEPIQLLAVPARHLEAFKRANEDTCENDPMMPKFSPAMVYVCGSKTHFTHALKLGKEGTHHVFNNSSAGIIKWKKNDVEAAECMKHGPLCVIYDSSIFQDLEAVEALNADGNLNSKIEMAEDEMQAFGRVDATFERLARSPDWQKINVNTIDEQVLQKIRESCGLGHFTPQEWRNLILLRKVLSVRHTKVLRTCQFEAVAGRIRARASDFGLLAKLDPRAPWGKVALLLWQYIGASSTGASQPNSDAIAFGVRKEVYAKTLSTSSINQLAIESSMMVDIEAEIKSALMHYSFSDPPAPGDDPVTFGQSKALFSARGEFLSQCGRLLLKVAAPLVEAEAKAKQREKALSPEERESILAKLAINNKYSKLETQYRHILVTGKVFTSLSLPVRRHAVVEDEAEPKAKVRKVDGSQPSTGTTAIQNACFLDGDDSHIALTVNDVFARLCISGFGEQIMVFLHTERATPIHSSIKEELFSDQENLSDAELIEELPDAEPIPVPEPIDYAWLQGTLSAMELPHCSVEITSEQVITNVDQLKVRQKTTKTYKVLETNLRCIVASIGKPKQQLTLHPSLQAAGSEMDAYDYEGIENTTLLCAIGHVLSSLDKSSQTSGERVKVYRQSEEATKFTGSLKGCCVLQCRVNETYKKGQLVLVPASGQLKLIVARDRDDSPDRDAGKKTKQLIDTSMLSEVQGSIRESVKDPRNVKKARVERPHRRFEIRSPLFDAQPKKGLKFQMSTLHPFWAVLRCVGPNTQNNMEMSTELIDVPQVEMRGIKKSLLHTVVEIPVLRNVSALEIGDILTLPWLAPDENEE